MEADKQQYLLIELASALFPSRNLEQGRTQSRHLNRTCSLVAGGVSLKEERDPRWSVAVQGKNNQVE